MRKRFNRWLVAFLHGIVLFVISWIWLSFYTTYGSEQMLIQWASVIKRTVLQMDEDPGKDEYLFINLSYDKELVPSTEVLGNDVITDRCKISQFMSVLKRNPNAFKFAFCDVYLAGDAPCDSSLNESVSGLKNIAFPVHYLGTDTLDIPKFNTNYGIADYETNDNEDAFLKFKMVQSGEYPSVPAYIYKTLDGGNIKQGKFFNTDNGTPIFNSMIIDFPIRAFEVFENNEYPVVNLSELLLMPEEILVSEFLKNKVILLGDFKNDVHDTMYDDTPGTLILLNVYLTLKNGLHKVSLLWVLMMLLFYTLVSYYIFNHERAQTKLEKHRKYSFLASMLNYLIVFGAISIASYIFFNVYVNILILALYANCLAFMVGVFKRTKHFPKPIDIFNDIKEFYFSFK